MRFDTVEELERIGVAGARLIEDENGMRARYLSSFWLYIEKDDKAFTVHWPTGYWESWTSAWLSKQWATTDSFVDVGANVGYFTFQAAVAGVDRVHSVEPNPELVAMLRKSAVINKQPNVSFIAKAFSDYNGKATLWVPLEHSGGANIENGAEGFDVEVIKIDDMQGLGKPGERVLFKIDAEGSEPKIWAGMQEFLKTRDCTLVLEWHGVRYDRHDFAEKLCRHQVSVVHYDGTELPVDYNWLVKTDDLHMICVRPIKEKL